jgi:hypothetical protein
MPNRAGLRYARSRMRRYLREELGLQKRQSEERLTGRLALARARSHSMATEIATSDNPLTRSVATDNLDKLYIRAKQQQKLSYER